MFEPRQGWEPLCAFLGKPVPPPDTPFPRVNDTQQFKVMVAGVRILMRVLTWGVPLVAVAGAAAVAARVWRCCGRR